MRGYPRRSRRSDAPSPLTVLTEEEALFRDSVREFAQAEIAPIARAMEAAGQYEPALLPKLFEMGLMGIDIAEEYGGAGGSFFQACLAVEELSRADAAVGVLVDVQNTLVNNAIGRSGTKEQQAEVPPAHGEGHGRVLLPLGSRLGSDAFALQCRATLTRRPLRARRPEALDHERRRGRPLPRLRERRPAGRLQGHHRVPRGEGRSGLRRWESASTSWDPARARRARSCSKAASIPKDRVARAGGQGLQDRDRDPERRPDRHRRADAGRGPSGRWTRRSATRRSASSSEST